MNNKEKEQSPTNSLNKENKEAKNRGSLRSKRNRKRSLTDSQMSSVVGGRGGNNPWRSR